MSVLTRRHSQSKSLHNEPASLITPHSKKKFSSKEKGKNQYVPYTPPNIKNIKKIAISEDQKSSPSRSNKHKSIKYDKPPIKSWYYDNSLTKKC